MTEQELMDMYNKLENARLTQVNQQKQDALNQLNEQKTQKTKDYYDARNGVDVTNAQNVNAIREKMASMGNLNGGANIQAQLNANTDRMNGLGKLKTEQDRYNQGIDDNINSTTNTYNNEINSTTADYDAKKIQAIDNLRQEQAAAQAKQLAAQKKVAAQQTPDPWETMKGVLNNGGYGAMIGWLQDNKDSLTSSVGSAEYEKMRKAATQTQEAIRQNEAYDRNSKSW